MCYNEKSTPLESGYLNTGWLKTKLFMARVKTVRRTLFRTTAIVLNICSRGQKGSSILNITRRSVNLQPKSRVRGSMNGKLLRGNVRSLGRLWLNRPSTILAEGGPGLMVEDEEFCCMSGMGILATLTEQDSF